MEQKVDKMEKSLDLVLSKLEILSINIEKFDKKFVDLEKKINEISTNIEKRLEEVKNSFSAKIKKVEKKILDLETKFSENEEAVTKATQVIVSGFPTNLNMNLKDLYKKLSSAIGFSYENNNIPSPPEFKIFQIKGDSVEKSPIFITFPTVFHKEIYMSNYYKSYKTLKLSQFGFEEDYKITINHNLNQKKYHAFRAALAFKKDKKINSVKVFGFGSIAVRMAAGEKFITISNKSEVYTLVANRPTTSC